MRLVPAVVATTCVLALAPRPAPADDGDASAVTRVHVALAGATAEIHVTLVLDHDGSGSQQHALSVPPRAVITGATVRTGDATHALALGDATAISDKLLDLQVAPKARSTVRAVSISDDGFGPIAVTLAPGRAVMVLELELEAATCFVDDRRYFKIPADWIDHLESGSGHVLDTTPASDTDITTESTPIDAACANGTDWSGDGAETRWLALPTTELTRRPVGDARLGTRAGRFAHKAIEAARVELALSSTISAVPDDLATVFVVDGSRSVDPETLITQAEVIASYAKLAPKSEVQVVAFDRDAQPLLGKWTEAKAAAPVIARELAALTPKNGSDLDRGLAEAGRLLADRTGTRRVVVFTDQLMPDRLAVLDPATLATTVPTGTVVHVVAVDSGTAELVRDDEITLAPLADATAGMPVRATGGTDEPIDALALVRPISLDHVRVIAPTAEAIDSTSVAGTNCVDPRDPDRVLDLYEGEACTWWATAPSTLDTIAVEGLLWGTKWRRVISLGDPGSVDVAREAWSVIDHDQMPGLAAAVDEAARVVNRKWSLFASWGGKGGYDEASGASFDVSGCGCMDSSVIDHVGVGTAVRINSTTVDAQVGAAIAACHAADDRATIAIELETTLDEIVGVDTTITGVAGDAATTMKKCVDRAVWDLALSVSPRTEHQHWSLAY